MSTIDRISPLLERFRVRARRYHTGPLCGVTTFAAQPGRGFLHILRAGELDLVHRESGGHLVEAHIATPSILFFPRPIEHSFRNAPEPDSDFACAALDVEGGATHPLVRTLPSVVVLPLSEAGALDSALEMLFAEIDDVRCGGRVLIDRLFEVVLIQLYRWLLDHSEELSLPQGLLPGLSDPHLAPALLAMHETPGRPWTLTSMARAAHMARSSFAARFKQVVGQSPADYLIDWRLTVAQERLRVGAPVAVTAAELGYADPSSFSRVFAQRVGRSPRAWLASGNAAV